MSEFPAPHLTPTAEQIVPGQPLAVQVSVTNPTTTPLTGATAEVTLEVERGVLISWQLTLAEVPAGGRVEQAIVCSEPDWTLPSNVAPGVGHLVITLWGPDGGWLNEDRLELPVNS